jgi:hypothetical protein
MNIGRDDGRDSGHGPDRGIKGERPRFLTLFAVLLLLVGGRMFITSISDLHHVVTGNPHHLSLDGSLDAQTEILLRAQNVLANALQKRNPLSVFAHGTARLVLALIYLFAVAALFSGDHRGRRVGQLCGTGGLATCFVHILFVFMVIRPILPGIIPFLTQALAEDATRAGRTPLPPELAAEHTHIFLVWVPLIVTLLGALFSLLLVVYFNSRRLRLFYNEAT